MDNFLHGTVHEAGEDLQAALQSDSKILALWDVVAHLGEGDSPSAS
ncbi:hypothetical protein [Limimaricola cinnabarinus]